MKVFVLSYLRPDANKQWGGWFIGVYSSQQQAARAVERLGRQPFFRDYPQGFQIDGVELDEDYQRAGFFQSPPPTPPPQ